MGFLDSLFHKTNVSGAQQQQGGTPDPYAISWDPETGLPVGLRGPPGEAQGLRYQFRADELTRQRNVRQRQAAQGYLDQAVRMSESFRPGGFAAVNAGLYSQKAQLAFNDQMESPDMLSQYRSDEAANARRRTRNAGYLAAAGSLLGSAVGAATSIAAGGMAGGPAPTAGAPPGLALSAPVSLAARAGPEAGLPAAPTANPGYSPGPVALQSTGGPEGAAGAPEGGAAPTIGPSTPGIPQGAGGAPGAPGAGPAGGGGADQPEGAGGAGGGAGAGAAAGGAPAATPYPITVARALHQQRTKDGFWDLMLDGLTQELADMIAPLLQETA